MYITKELMQAPVGLEEIIRSIAAVSGAAAYTGIVGYLGYQLGKAASALQRRGTTAKGRKQVAVITKILRRCQSSDGHVALPHPQDIIF